MAEAAPCLWMLAGTNGSGKSSIGGEFLRRAGGDYFNPDEAARRIRDANPGFTQAQANGAAWGEGIRQLEEAISLRREHFFETTLGGETFTRMLELALAAGFEVRIWYVGLRSPELHIARVAARVRKGGHDIPEGDIRRRYDNSRRNLVRLLPRLTELRLHDNSAEANPASRKVPAPRLILHMQRGKILGPADLTRTPEWTKPIVSAALKPAGTPERHPPR